MELFDIILILTLSLVGMVTGDRHSSRLLGNAGSQKDSLYLPGGPSSDYVKYAQRIQPERTVLYARYRPYGKKPVFATSPVVAKSPGPSYSRKHKTAFPNPLATTFISRPLSHQMSSNYQPPKYGEKVRVSNRLPEAFTTPPIVSSQKEKQYRAPSNRKPVNTHRNFEAPMRRRRPLVKKPHARQYDPCVDERDGEYVLTGKFRKPFPYTDNMCFFVKCANKKVFLNACGIGTRNNDDGSGFCSVLDLEGYCGRTVYDIDPNSKKPVPGSGGYREHTHGINF